MKKLSGFDIGMIIAFVVVGLLGYGAYYYFSGQLATAQAAVSAADSDRTHYSTQQVYLPTEANVKTLENNLALIHKELDPIIDGQLKNPGDKLPDMAKADTDTVKWKQHLDEEAGKLNAAAKTQGVTVPPNFYYGFSRYLSANPANDQIVVLSKQLLGVVEMANILIGAPVREIDVIRRTAEEDQGAATGTAPTTLKADSDILPGHSSTAPGGVYTAYPFELEFVGTTAALRKVVDGLLKSPYIFVIRDVTVANKKTDSPAISELDQMAGLGAPGVAETAPGSVGTTKSSLPPVYLFGNEMLSIKIQVDLIEWNGISTGAAPEKGSRPGGRGGNGRAVGGNAGGPGGPGGNE